MFLLPTFNAALRPCSVNTAEFTAHEKGHFCGSCQRVVQDFSRSTNPLADLAAARAASPDGRVCGSFRAAQVQPPRTLTRRLRWFLLALVLVVGQGLTAREALAQVRRATPHKHTSVTSKRPAAKPDVVPTQVVDETLIISGIASSDPTELEAPNRTQVYTYAEHMPTFRGGGTGALVAYIEQQVRKPAKAADVEGRVFISFIVGKDGLVRDAKVIKGLHPLLDAEVLRVVQDLTGFAAGQQNGEAVDVSMTLPVTFKLQ